MPRPRRIGDLSFCLSTATTFPSTATGSVPMMLLTGAFTDFSYWMLETYQFLGLPLPG